MKKSIVLFCALTAFTLIGKVHSQELTPGSESDSTASTTVPTGTVENQTVLIGEAIDALVDDEEEAAALQEYIAQETKKKKQCEAAAADWYAEQIRLINSLPPEKTSPHDKRASRETARECFMDRIAACHGAPETTRCISQGPTPAPTTPPPVGP